MTRWYWNMYPLYGMDNHALVSGLEGVTLTCPSPFLPARFPFSPGGTVAKAKKRITPVAGFEPATAVCFSNVFYFISK